MIAGNGDLEEDSRAATTTTSPDDLEAVQLARILTGLACQQALNDKSTPPELGESEFGSSSTDATRSVKR